MPTKFPEGFISKKQATQKFNRSPRQLTRDITEAITLRKDDVLPHLILKTDDDKIHNSSEISLGRIKEMKANGENPMWFVQSSWMKDRFGIRDPNKSDAPKEQNNTEPEVSARKTDSEQGTGRHNDDFVALLKEQNADLKKDKDKLLNLVEELTENQKQNNVLTQDLHKLLIKEEESPDSSKSPTVVIPSQSQTSTIDVKLDEAQPEPVTATKRAKKNPKRANRKAKQTPKPSPKKKGFFETTTPTFYNLFTK